MRASDFEIRNYDKLDSILVDPKFVGFMNQALG